MAKKLGNLVLTSHIYRFMMKRQCRAELSNEEDSRAPRKTSEMHKHDSTDHLTESSAKTNKVRLFID